MPRIEHSSDLTNSSAYAGSKSQSQNARLGERFIAIWDCGAIDAGLAAVDVVFAEKFINREPLIGPTREDYKSELRTFATAFPNLLAVAQAIIAESGGGPGFVAAAAGGAFLGGLPFFGVDDALAARRTLPLRGIGLP